MGKANFRDKKMFIFFGLVFLALVALIYPVRFKYHYKSWTQLPDFVSYEEAYKGLVSEIQTKAESQHCRGYIRPLQESDISGPDRSLPFLVSDMNFALHSYKGWTLNADEKIREEMRERWDKQLETWGALMDSGEVMDFLQKQLQVARQTWYSAKVRWEYQQSKEGFVTLRFTVYDERIQASLFEITTDFIHPAALDRWKSDQKKSSFSLTLFFIFSGLTFLFACFLFLFQAFLLWKRNRRKKCLLQEIQKAESLLKEGHYVALVELLEEYLVYFPKDTEQRAFYYRVLDFTGNDPKTAQTAYVETKKLQSRLQQYLDHPQSTILTEEEKEKLKPLMAHHPELKATVTQLTALESSAQKQEEAETASEHIIQAIRLGDLEEAQHDVTILESHGYDSLQLGQWKEDIEAKRTEAQRLFSEAKGLLSKGNIQEGEKKLSESLSVHRENKEALLLKETIARAESHSRKQYHLTSQNRDIYIIFKESLLLGRGDEGIAPDILFEDRRVSRKHATLTYEKGKWMINDLESTGGTYVNGSAVHSSPLNDGDTLTLAKVHEFLIHAVIPDKGSPGLVLEGRHSTYLIFPTEGSFAKASFMKTDKEHTLFLSKEKTRLLLSWEEGFHFIIPGDSIETPHADFRILEN